MTAQALSALAAARPFAPSRTVPLRPRCDLSAARELAGVFKECAPCPGSSSTFARGRASSDDEGLEFANLDQAEREAATAVAEIGRDRLPCGEAREITIEVRDEHRQRVLTISVSMHVERVFPPPVA